MKRILLLGILLSSMIGVFAQETKEKAKKGLLIMAPYFGVFTRIEGQSSFGNNNMVNYNTVLSTTGIEVFLGKKKFYFYTQFYFQYDMGRNAYYVDELVATSPYAIGNLVGMGGYLFDKRSSLGTGWSMVMNGGVGSRVYFLAGGHKTDGSIGDSLESIAGVAALFTSFSFEINTLARYHISQNLGIQFGTVVALDMIAPRSGTLAMRYGLSFGVVF